VRLYLIRHPRTLAPPDVCYGSSDVEVSEHERGIALARLRGVLPRELAVYSSVRRRCLGLARELASALGSGPPIGDPRLVEMDFGAWELRPWSAIPRAEVDAWVRDLIAYHPGGGESLEDMACRIGGFCHDMRTAGRDAIVVCHGGSIKMLVAWSQVLEGCAETGTLGLVGAEDPDVGSPGTGIAAGGELPVAWRARIAEVARLSVSYGSAAYGSCVVLDMPAGKPAQPAS